MHTPGPWEAHDTSGSEPTVCQSHGGNTCTPLATLEWGRSENNDNARLMAAAPDLYEAIGLADKYLTKDNCPSDVLNKVSKAIAKAEGR